MILRFIVLSLPIILSAADKQDPYPTFADVTITTHNSSAKLPLYVAQLSSFMRDYMEQPIFAQTNVISLKFQGKPLQDAFELELLIPFVTQANATLTAKPISSQGSYVQLASKKPLTSVNNPEKLLKLFIACDFLKLDHHQPSPTNKQYESVAAFLAAHQPRNNSEVFKHLVGMHYDMTQHNEEQPVLKAIALRIAQLGLKDPFPVLDKIALKMNYNFKDIVWPYIQAQCFLLKQPLVYDATFDVCLRDLLVHHRLESHYHNDSLGLSLDLTNLRLISLDDINYASIKEIRMLLLQHNKLKTIPYLHIPSLHSIFAQNNALTAFPDLKLPHLKHLDLRNNNITSIPNDLSDLAQLESLDLRGNPVTKIPHNFTKPLYLTIFLDNHTLPSEHSYNMAVVCENRRRGLWFY